MKIAKSPLVACAMEPLYSMKFANLIMLTVWGSWTQACKCLTINRLFLLNDMKSLVKIYSQVMCWPLFSTKLENNAPMTQPKWCAYWTNCHLRNVGLQVWRWTTGHLGNFKPSKTGRKMLESLIGVLSSGRGTDLYRFVPILFEVHWMGKPVNLGKHLTPQIYLVV